MRERPSSRQPSLDLDLKKALEPHLGSAAPDESALLARVEARVLRTIQGEEAKQHLTIRASEDAWETLAPGVERKVLWATASSISCLLRLTPGVVIPAHLHPMDEECLVLEGSVRIGGELLLHPGDFHVGCKGSTHEEITTETGALAYLRGALHVIPA